MSELLPAFVTPNDPALTPLLRSTAVTLGQNGHSTALDGYQSRDPNRVYLLAAALWSAISGCSLIYANPPGSFERVGQKTRRVRTVLSDGLATCLDISLLIASGLEAIGLNSVLVMTKGHCFAGVWLVDKNFKRLVETDCCELRKAIAANELIVFETTLLTQQPPVKFPDAVTTANRAVVEEKEDEFVAVIDVARSRMSQILPLASHSERKESASEVSESAAVPLPTAPGFDSLPVSQSEERPSTPAGRIERWQRKLLDLSLRNRLLNFRPTKDTVPILCPDISRLEDQLANGVRLRLVSLSEGNPLGQRDPGLHQQRTQKDLDAEFARQALARNEVVCPVELRDLEARLTTLFRKVRNDLAEGGSNTLYLAVGFLRWKQNPTDERVYRAPLLLVPVNLSRRSASSPYYLVNHEDEVRFNATLLQLLKKDFDCDLTALESNLPMDDSGVDVPQVLTQIRQFVREIPGCEVVEEAAIAPFSFAKYLMWKDLVDRVGQLEQNRVIRHLIHDPDKAFSPAASKSMPRPFEIDERYDPKEIIHPLPADSSQLAAVMAASEGHDLVIVGPPGTGKSQTITNLIAQCLAIGKTVLFVAEKTAALDVVHRRLRDHGLGDCCVELHSNKAERRRFLDQLESSWNNLAEEHDSDWVTINEQLRVRRDQLNSYSDALHVVEANGWNAYRAMGECVRGRDLFAPRLNWDRTIEHDHTKYRELETTIAELAATFELAPTEVAMQRVEADIWSMTWETNLLESCRQLSKSSESLAGSIKSLSSILSLPGLSDISAGQLSTLYRLAHVLTHATLPPADILVHPRIDDLQIILNDRIDLLNQKVQANKSLDAALSAFSDALGASVTNLPNKEWKCGLFELAKELVSSALPASELVFHKQFDFLVKALAERPVLIYACEQAFESLQARSFAPPLINRIDIETIEKEWAKASSSVWPLSSWRKKRTIKNIQAYMTGASTAAPEVDLPLLHEFKEARKGLAENLASLGLPKQLASTVEKDVAALDPQIESARKLREMFLSIGLSPDSVGETTQGRLDPLVSAAHNLFTRAKQFEVVRVKLKQNLETPEWTPSLRDSVDNDSNRVSSQIQEAKAIQKAAIEFGLTGDQFSKSLQGILAVTDPARQDSAVKYCKSAKEFQKWWASYTQYATVPPVVKESATIVSDAFDQAQRILSNRTGLKTWTSWIAVQKKAKHLELNGFIDALKSGELDKSNAVSRFRLAYARWWLPAVIDRKEPLRVFQKHIHEAAIEDFRKLDDQARRAAEPRTRHAVLHHLPPSDQVPRKSELGLLRHQMGLKRPSKSIREMIAGMSSTFAKLAPCLLMSPLSIAQYLPANQELFDVVVFDEASQIATWDAIGAIARGKQTIIVGDPKQLPPTNFFGRAESDEENEGLEDHEKDLESILDEVQASGLPTLQLNWHYRSRHESLIAFSNWNYYGNRLVTFPAAEAVDQGVSLHHVQGGLYDRGKSRTNRLEAESIVADIVERMKHCLRRPEDERWSYGVVTFNSQQQELIQDLLDEAQRRQPELEWFFSDERIEPTVVKNLENVQGDERDVMLFSITFGFDASGKFPVDFGAINRNGGERRLNVAITRARQELAVYVSFLPDQLRAERSTARGVHDLKAFLEYANKGPEAIISRIEGSVGGYESPLEESVAAELQKRGWKVDSQIGVSEFRIDIGIVHPDKPGSYLAGVECDGATYHRSAIARDRDKIRQQVLEGLGWNIVRVWSTDWWYAAETAINQIHSSLNDLLARDRKNRIELEASDITEESTFSTTPDDHHFIEPPIQANDVVELPFCSDADSSESELAEPNVKSQVVSQTIPFQVRNYYRRCDLGDVSGSQNRFFDDNYTETLRAMAMSVLQVQGPIREDVLARDVAQAHGFIRTSNRIKQRILVLLPDATRTEESIGTFLWPGASASKSIPFRYSTENDERRSLDEIVMAELTGLVREHPSLAKSDDPALALAREIGLARLARTARDRLEEALEYCADFSNDE